MRPIVDLIEDVVVLMRAGGEVPYYEYGTTQYLSNMMLSRGKDNVNKYKRYPLIAFKLPTTPAQIDNGIWSFSLNIAFIALSNEGYTVRERYEKIFKPVLYPLYQSFLDSVRLSGNFMWPNNLETPKHQQRDWYDWGTLGPLGLKAHMFNDPVEAIELTSLELKVDYKNCD